MSRRHQSETRRNREIGLVQRKRTEEENDPWKQTNILREFEELRKTLAVVQNQDQEWQRERNEIGAMVKQIEEKRVVLGILMHLNPSHQERQELNRFLVNQKKSLDLMKDDTNKRYLLNVNFTDIPTPFLF